MTETLKSAVSRSTLAGVVAIAFFDFDKTLIRKNSGSLWLLEEVRRGAISYVEFLRAGLWLARYSVGFVDLEEGIRMAVRSLAGTREDDLRERVQTFYASKLKDLYRPGAKNALEAHRAQGEQLVLLTSASNYLSEIVVEELRLDGFLANRFEVDDNGIFSANSVGELCYGAGKLVHARAYAEASGADLADCAFYTDSTADLSVLEVVGRPVAVNPDPRLPRIANARQWPVQDWG